MAYYPRAADDEQQKQRTGDRRESIPGLPLRFWVLFSAALVAFRFCSATRAPTFVLMLLAILAVLCLQTMSDAILAAGSFLLGRSGRKGRANSASLAPEGSALIFQC